MTTPTKPSSLTPEEQHITSLVNQLCQSKTPLETNDEIMNTLTTLQRLILNIISEPDEMKYRRIRKSNAAIQRTLMNNSTAITLLKLFGFEDDPSNNDFFQLPINKVYNETVAMIVLDTVTRIEQEIAERNNKERNKAYLDMLKRQEEEKKARDRINQLAKQDQLERKEREQYQRLNASNCTSPTTGGNGCSSIKTYRDIGIDLNRKRGG